LNYLIDDKNLKAIARESNFSLFDRKSVLVTGGTGMIGSYLVEAIVRGSQIQGFFPSEIKVTGRTVSLELQKRFANHNNVKVSVDPLVDATKTGDNQLVFHLASPASPSKYRDLASLVHINSDCLSNVIKPSVEKFVFFSTSEVYGNNKKSPALENECGAFGIDSPRDWYPHAKLKGEETSRELCRAYNSELKIVRLFHTFGPGVKKSDGRSFADFLYAAAYGESPKLYSDGSSLRTFLFSADAVMAILAIANNIGNEETYNVGSDIPISILDFAKKVSDLAGLNGRVSFDSDIAKGFMQSPNEALIPDLSKITQLGWKNRTSLEESIQNTLDFIKSNPQMS
jgi:nucleoside-diphosphate-sugar epimerase